MTKHRFHPACLLFPPLSKDELRSLADDIRERGLLHPVTRYKGTILDGRNRLLACELAGVKPRFQEWQGKGSPLEWAISTNLHRRHLTASQRAVLALDALPLLEAEAKERQRLSAGRGKKVAKKLAIFSPTGKASQIAAKMAGTNSAYVEKVKTVGRKAPELIDQVRTGRLTIRDAGLLSKLETCQREKILADWAEQPGCQLSAIVRQVKLTDARATTSKRRPTKNRTEIWCGDCLSLMRNRLNDESVDVICTSPPYNRDQPYASYDDHRDPIDFQNWLSQIFEQFQRVLAPTGSFFLIVGHSPKQPWTAIDMASLASRYFKLQNQIVWVKSITLDGKSQGHFRPIAGKKYLNRNWEFVFHFTKQGDVALDRQAVGTPHTHASNLGRGGAGAIRCDGDVWFVPHETVQSNVDRVNHPATFPSELAKRCLLLAGVQARSVVLDPFCGVNGMVAAAELGVKGIGIDIDPGYCREAAARAGTKVQMMQGGHPYRPPDFSGLDNLIK